MIVDEFIGGDLMLQQSSSNEEATWTRQYKRKGLNIEMFDEFITISEFLMLQ